MGIILKEVRIKNFRSHKNTRVSLEPLTLLVGSNNAGKTSFLRAISVGLNAERKFISREDLYIDKDGIQDAENKIEIDLKIVSTEADNKFDDNWALVFGTDIKTDANGYEFLAFRTSVDFNTGNQDALTKRYIITDWESDTADENTELSAKIYYLPLYFIDAQRDLQEDLKTSSSYFGRLAKQIEYDKKDLKKIEESLKEINDVAVSKSKVLEHLKKSLKELNNTVQTNGEGVEITPFPKKIRDLHKGLKVHFQDGASDSFSIEYHGMGTRSWASLLAFKAFIDWESKLNEEAEEPFYPLLALEEPEAHLHPNAQRQLYTQLTSISGQKIISTHSPYVAGQADLKELRHFYKALDTTEVNKIDVDSLSSEEQRKLRREIFNTRGELLFSKIVVLSEGETEEQSLPIFAKKYWDVNPFEIGVTFVGCGGNNYKAFLKLFEAFNIKWFIFSDYDNPSVVSELKSALKIVKIDNPETQPNVILLNKGYEKYLIDEGYENELKQAVIKLEEPVYANETHRKAKEKEVEDSNKAIMAWTKDELLKKLENYKTKLSPIYSENITSIAGEKSIPTKVLELFKEVDKILKSKNKNEEDNAVAGTAEHN